MELLAYDEDRAFVLMDVAATVNAVVRRVPPERLRAARFGEWDAVELIGHVTDIAEVFAERVRRAVEEESPALTAVPEGMLGDSQRDPMDLARRLLAAHQRIVALLAAPGSADRPAVHQEWGRVTAGHLAAYEGDHSSEHAAELSRAFPPR